MPFRVLSFSSSLVRPTGLSLYSTHFREMGQQVLTSKCQKEAHFRLCNVSSYVTELLEIHADEPTFHVLFIPGNPGVVTFYKDFLESFYEILGGSVSVTAVGHISHTMKLVCEVVRSVGTYGNESVRASENCPSLSKARDWEHRRLFSLQDQIDQKVDFIKQEFQNTEVPVVLVGHSIGAYISIETFKRIPEKVIFCVGLYPFLASNPQSRNQFIIEKVAKCPIICVVLSSIVGLLGLLPIWALKFIVCRTLGKTWSNTAVEAGCSHLAKYHTVRNILFMAMTEFEKLSETPDWAFMRENQQQIAFLFGIDDHWGPLQMFEEISRQAPQIGLLIEREGHSHAFCCTEAGSSWVANHVAALIIDQISRSSSHININPVKKS